MLVASTACRVDEYSRVKTSTADSELDYYMSLPLEELGMCGCCKVFCQEYLNLEPTAEIWGVRRPDDSVAHVFIHRQGRSFDIRGERTAEEMSDDSTGTVSKIEHEHFESMFTWADAVPALQEAAKFRFREALKTHPSKYGLK
jgi:hypothetical protein